MIDFKQAVEEINRMYSDCDSLAINGVFTVDPENLGDRQETTSKIFPIEYLDQYGNSDHGFSGNIHLPVDYKDQSGQQQYIQIQFWMS